MSALNPRISDEQKELPEKSQIYEELESLYGYIVKVVRRYINTYPDYEDMVSDVYLNCLTSLDFYRGNCALKTWVYRIILRRIVDYIRLKEKRNECGLGERHEFTLCCSQGEFYARQERKNELKQHVYSCFGVLSGRQKKIFRFLLVGLTRSEIARILYVSPGTVHYHYTSGLSKLRSEV